MKCARISIVKLTPVVMLAMAGVAKADCSLKDVFFGQVSIQIVTHNNESAPYSGFKYETGMIVAGNNNSQAA